MQILQNDESTVVGGEHKPDGYRISIGRIIVLSIASWGLYWFYWMYRTWKQYRDHAGATAYPVWHVLTQFVPIYEYFRFYAHCKAYKNLMEESGIESSLNLTAIMFTWIIATTIRFQINTRSLRPGFTGQAINEETDLVLDIIGWIASIVTFAVVCWIQTNINRYWASVDSALVARARIRKGEILVVVIGIIIWIFTVINYLPA